MGILTSCLIISSKLVAKNTEDDSIFGITIAFGEANLDFAIIKISGLYRSHQYVRDTKLLHSFD